MSKAKRPANDGQAGAPIELTFGKMNVNERSIVEAAHRLGVFDNKMVRAALGWDVPDPKKGSSRVRNGLRRLVRGGWIVHTSDIGDGQYSLSKKAQALVKSGPGQAGPSPKPSDQAVQVEQLIKRPDCAFYNACLAQACSGKWANFSCESCNAYTEHDPEQKMQDMLALRALDTAAEMIEKDGRLGRVRGAKSAGDRINP